jgi:hypothetical protein
MGGIVKGIKKAFKAVTGFVKKYWKEILTIVVVAVACYFTLGMAAAAMPAASTGAAAAGTTAGATYGGMATAAAAEGVAAGTAGAAAAGAGAAAAGAGAAAAGGAVTLGTVSVTGSAAAAGLTAGEVAAGIGAAAGGVAAANAMSSGADAAKSAQQSDIEKPKIDVEDLAGPQRGAPAPYTAEGAAAPTSMAGKAVGAVKGFWGGMSTGEKLMFASTAFQALSGAMAEPSRAEQGLWPGGAYFGMDEKGNKTDLAGAYSDALTGKTTSASAQAGAAEGGGPAAQVGSNPGGTMAAAMGGDQGAQQPSAASAFAGGGATPKPSAVPVSQEFMPAVGGASGAAAATAQQSDALARQQQQSAEFFEKQRERA